MMTNLYGVDVDVCALDVDVCDVRHDDGDDRDIGFGHRGIDRLDGLDGLDNIDRLDGLDIDRSGAQVGLDNIDRLNGLDIVDYCLGMGYSCLGIDFGCCLDGNCLDNCCLGNKFGQRAIKTEKIDKVS